MRKSGKSPLLRSFGYAFTGIGRTIRDERNMKIHLVFTALVIIGGIVLAGAVPVYLLWELSILIVKKVEK